MEALEPRTVGARLVPARFPARRHHPADGLAPARVTAVPAAGGGDLLHPQPSALGQLWRGDGRRRRRPRRR